MGKKHKNQYNDEIEQMEALDALNAFIDGQIDSLEKRGKHHKKKDKDDPDEFLDDALSGIFGDDSCDDCDDESDTSEHEYTWGQNGDAVKEAKYTHKHYPYSKPITPRDSAKNCDPSEIEGILIHKSVTKGYPLIVFNDGVRSIPINLFAVDAMEPSDKPIDDSMVSGYALASLGYLMPAFVPQAIIDPTNKCHTKCVTCNDGVYDDDKFKFYIGENGSLICYYIPDESINTYIEVCHEMNEKCQLANFIKLVHNTLTGDAFNNSILDFKKIAMMSELGDNIQYGVEFIKLVMGSMDITANSGRARNIFDIIYESSPALPLDWYKGVDTIFEMMDNEFEYVCDDDEEDEDDDEEDDMNEENLNDYEPDDESETYEVDVLTDEDDIENAVESEKTSYDVKEHMQRVLEYAMNHNDDNDESEEIAEVDADELFDDVEDSQDVKTTTTTDTTIRIKKVTESKYSANANTDDKSDDGGSSDDSFVVRRR